MIEEKIILDILDSREERSNYQRELIGKYNSSLISFTLNAPGTIKDNPIYRKIHEEGIRSILEKINDNNISILYKEELYKSTGSEGFIVVDIESIKLKNLMISIEDDHPLGRIFDIDIFDFNHNQISRKDLDIESRKCLICNNKARICIREKNHNYEELISKIELLAKKHIANLKGK